MKKFFASISKISFITSTVGICILQPLSQRHVHAANGECSGVGNICDSAPILFTAPTFDTFCSLTPRNGQLAYYLGTDNRYYLASNPGRDASVLSDGGVGIAGELDVDTNYNAGGTNNQVRVEFTQPVLSGNVSGVPIDVNQVAVKTTATSQYANLGYSNTKVINIQNTGITTLYVNVRHRTTGTNAVPDGTYTSETTANCIPNV